MKIHPHVLSLLLLVTACQAGDVVPEAAYTGPVTVVSGVVGPSASSLFLFGAYPTPGSVWRYKTDFTQATLATFIAANGVAWRSEAFNDTAWASGPSQIGVGDSPRDEVTLVTRVDYDAGTSGVQIGPVALFRAKFTLPDLAAISSVTGTVRFDDSCVVYVNGTQIFRHSDILANSPLTEYTQVTPGASTRENATAPLTIPLNLVRAGENTIAVEVRQYDPGSGDMSFDLNLAANSLASITRWTTANSPYHMTGDVIVPVGMTLIIEPGVRVFANENARLIVNGVIQVEGTAAQPVSFSHFPGAPLVDDPREPGNLTYPPKWGGILIQDSLSPENRVRHATFYGAQPSDVEGSVTVTRSACVVSHCEFCATYLHGVYGRNCSLTVEDCRFPSVFPPGKEALGEDLDNLSEFIEVDSPTGEVSGNAAFSGGFPIGGHLRIYRNHFYGSSGHNDLIDITAGRWGVTPVLDVQDNHFHGPTGDEHIDLNGDAYIAGNIFENCAKDAYTSDNGYANAISSDAAGANTTIVVTRNTFIRCDHAVNVKSSTGVIFEHNTVTQINADYPFVRGTFNQAVKTSAMNCFIPEDTGRAGDGGYLAGNIFYGGVGGAAFTRLVSWADRDLATRPAKTTKLEMWDNFIDPGIQDAAIGNRPENVLSSVWRPVTGNPKFTDPGGGNYTLAADSPAKGTGPNGLDFGATAAAGCFIADRPPLATRSHSANLTIGGPGIFSYRWRLNGGPWSAAIAIAPGVFPRTGATVRTAVLALVDLPTGLQSVEVVGQDFAGNWQVTPTLAQWQVSDTPPLDFPSWLAWSGAAAAVDGDWDGLSPLAEFALGLDAKLPEGASVGYVGSSFSVSLPTLPAAGVRYIVESSVDLGNASWTPVATQAPGATWAGPVTLNAPENGRRTLIVTVPANAPRLFWRLRFEWMPGS
jgi:hypothetical protein